MTVPSSVYDYDVRTRELTLLKQQPVRGHDPAAYEEHRLWATADDGVQVPISLVCRAGRGRRTGPIPFLLYGYGAYEISIDPGFSVSRLSLLDRGAGMAIAHVRGGGEMGRHWYDDGKLLHKQHTFSDFAACARHLVADGLDDPRPAGRRGRLGRRAADRRGRQPSTPTSSAASSPTCRSSTPSPRCSTRACRSPSPSTTSGATPGDPEAYDYLAGYAPYENVAAVDYPPILATTSLHDTRVLYVEAAKWVARLRATADRRGATSCSRPRCRPATAGSRGATRPGATGRSPTPGSSTGWASRRQPPTHPTGGRLRTSPENSLRVRRGGNSAPPHTSGMGEGSETPPPRESSRHPVRWSRCG